MRQNLADLPGAACEKETTSSRPGTRKKPTRANKEVGARGLRTATRASTPCLRRAFALICEHAAPKPCPRVGVKLGRVLQLEMMARQGWQSSVDGEVGSVGNARMKITLL